MIGLTNSELANMAPAIFADNPGAGVSDQYAFIPTTKLVNQLRDRGWFPTSARQSRGSGVDPMHTTHMVTFRRTNAHTEVGEVVPEIRLVNDHLARRAWKLFAGLFRKVCKNGMVMPAGQNSETRVIHRGDAMVSVDAALRNTMLQIDRAYSRMAEWQTLMLDASQQYIYSYGVAAIRYDGDVPNGVTHGRFTVPRRVEDQGSDLWHIFNVAQENIIKGGIRPARRLLAPVRSIDRENDLNTRLWAFTEGFAASMKGS
jgi:hypothetical protein